MQNAYQMVIRICVRAPLNLIFAIVACFLINPEMAMIFVYVTIFFGSRLKHHHEDCLSTLSQKYLKLMTISTTAFKKTSPICGWSLTLRKQMKRLNSRRLRVWFTTCLWRLSVSLSWVAQLWCFPCMLLSFDLMDWSSSDRWWPTFYWEFDFYV